jgi:hypothetical protein
VSRGDSKDRSLYSISFNDEVFERDFRKSDIGYNTVKLLESKGLIDERVFALLRDDTSCSFKLLKLQNEMTETEMRYAKYRHRQDPEITYDGKGYYIARNWGVANTPKFIAKMERAFPSLKYSSDGV